jgi:hypothetical protein
MKRSSIYLFSVLWVACALTVGASGLYSQTADAGHDAASQEGAPPSPQQAIAPESRKAAVHRPDVNAQAPAPQVFQGGLLEISESEYRYNRIPGKIVAKPVAESFVAADSAPQQPVNAESGAGTRGIFGFSPEASNYIAKGALVFVIVLIFLMYRLRSRSRSGGVLKRFP